MGSRCRGISPSSASTGIASEWTQPSLTTIEQPIAEIAETAVDALRRLIDDPDKPLPHFVFRPHLRLGGSTGPPSEPS